MGPRAWIIAGRLLLVLAGVAAIAAVIQVVGGGSPVACLQRIGVSCQSGGGAYQSQLQIYPGLGGTMFLTGLICAVAAGVAFFSALAAFFWAAHLRTLAALRDLAEASRP